MIADAFLRAAVWAAATPAPTPSGTPNDDQVTPGYVGFLVTFFIAVAVVLLILDMVRRIRRVRYRAEIAEKLDAEQGTQTRDGAETRDSPDVDPR
ncbi:MAG: hypothetical protein ABI130_00200 [Leifsonia sp.]